MFASQTDYTFYLLPLPTDNYCLYGKRTLKTYTSKNQLDPHPVTLAIHTEGASDRPRQITNMEEFTKRPFDDLWQEAITPRYRLDRSYADNLEASHIR
jgi:hypothetical protein